MFLSSFFEKKSRGELRSRKFIANSLFVFTPALMSAMFYVFFRKDIVFFNFLNLDSSNYIHIESNLANSFPSFAFAYLISVVSFVFFKKSSITYIVAFWVCLGALFEFGQSIVVSSSTVLPGTVAKYVFNGTFSWLDILALIVSGFFSHYFITVYKRWLND